LTAGGIVAAVAAVLAIAHYSRKSARVTEEKLDNAERDLEEAAFARAQANPNTMMGMEPVEGPMAARELARRGQAPARAEAIQPPVPQVAEGQQVADLGAPAPTR
jgi:hypothetical protein